MWILAFLISSAFAQEDVDVKAIRKLEDKLPRTEFSEDHHDTTHVRENRWNYELPIKKVEMKTIAESGISTGAVNKGAYLIRLQNNERIPIEEHRYVKYFRQEDEYGYKYLQNKDGSIQYKIRSDSVSMMKEDTVLYEPPKTYRPYEKAVVPIDYDHKLTIRPEVIFAAGLVRGDYMKDLFNDENARSGRTFRYGANAYTDWKLPVKIGGTFQYESTQYNLRMGQLNYSAFSFGPIFKTKDFVAVDTPFRFHGQFRVSPFAKASVVDSINNSSLKFNSADFLLGIEHPLKNSWGEFNVGLFYQAQWLSIKDQSEAVSLQARNGVNTSFGMSFSQVFQ